MLTHDQMKAAIARGGVMQMADGRTIHRVEELPSPADLAIQSNSAVTKDSVKATPRTAAEGT